MKTLMKQKRQQKLNSKNNNITYQSKNTLCTKMKIHTLKQNEKIKRQKLTIIQQKIFFVLNHKKKIIQKLHKNKKNFT